MKPKEDCLVEIHTEELPSKSLFKLAEMFAQQIKVYLQKAELSFDEIKLFATPRRIAVLIKNLIAEQPDQVIERKGPSKQAAFDDKGKPTPALIGFARSCKVTPNELTIISHSQGEWLGYKQLIAGEKVEVFLPALIQHSLSALPIQRRMRWGKGEAQFARPVHSVILLYGDQVIDATFLGCRTGRMTEGHRFHSTSKITIPHAADYESLLETEGHVIADFVKRRQKIKESIEHCVKQT